MNFVALDVETANSARSSICQIGVAIFENGQYQRSWETLVNPEVYFDEINISIHNISEDMVKNAPTFPNVHKELHQYLTQGVVVTHMPFDRVAMSRVHEKYSLDLPTIDWLDSAMAVRRTWKDRSQKGYGLKSITEFLGIDFQHHDAAEDARAAGEVLLHALKVSGHSLEDLSQKISAPLSSNSTQYSKDIKQDGNPDGVLYGESIVFTGRLTISRREAATHAANAGCIVQNSVTKTTTLLVAGDQDLDKLAGHEKSSKHRKAEALIVKGIPIRILGETDFYSMVAPEIAETLNNA
jgi:DNA polymerase-3 subunit epsilon